MAVASLNGAQKDTTYELLDTMGDHPEYDFSQEYRNYNKKDVIEIQYDYKEVSDKVSNLFTLGIMPTASWNYKIFIYDFEGKKKEFKELESELVSEYWGIMIFPSRIFQSKEGRLELAKERLKFMIEEATALAIKNEIKLESFDSSYQLRSLPFRMKPATGQCQSIVSTGMNAPGIRTTWRPSPLHRGCDIVIKFSSHSDKVINIDTQQFTLVTDKKLYKAKKEIQLYQRNLSGNAATTNSAIQPVLQSFNLQPNTTGTERLELFFEYPMDEKPLLVKWMDPNQSSAVVEVTVPK